MKYTNNTMKMSVFFLKIVLERVNKFNQQTKIRKSYVFRGKVSSSLEQEIICCWYVNEKDGNGNP